MSQYKIGDVVGKNNSLLILERVKKGKRLLYRVQCQICRNDTELYGDATYTIDGDYFNKGKLPCGCSDIPKRSYEQWQVIIKRKSQINNHNFHGFVKSEKIDQNTKCKLSCNVCNHFWDTCSINNYLRDRKCPNCANLLKAKKKSTSDIEWITRFRKTGMFPEDQYSFERQTETGRLWKVVCINCEGLTFISDRSNLVAGKIPCNCGTGGGYDINKTGYFYLLTVSLFNSTFLKFGITNFPKRRIGTHKRVISLLGGQITKEMVFKGDGSLVLNIESDLKRKIDAENKLIEGFKKEACSLDNLQTILDSVTCLEKMTENLKI